MQGWADRWPLVGRQPLLDSFAQDLPDGHTHGWMICGPAGVGKTRLAEEFLELAVAVGGQRTARAVASKAAAQIPLSAIAHLLPPDVDLTHPVSGFRAVSQTLAGPPGKPTVVFVDDMHLLDSSSAVLLGQLLDSQVIALIGTARTGEPVSDAVEALLQRGDRVRRIDLSHMDRTQVEILVQRVLGGLVGRRTLHALFTASGGNVLFLRELVLGAVESGTLSLNGEVWEVPGQWLAVTPHLNDLITAKIASAPPAALPLLQSLALCGPLSVTDAASIIDRAHLAEVESSGIIRITAHGRRITVALSHPLYSEVIAAGLSPLQRYDAGLHLAERLETHGLKRRDDALHIASWRLAAIGTADPALLTHAATIAMNANDNEQVIELLTAIKPDHHTLETRVLLGRVLTYTGHLERAEAILAEADAHARNDQEKITAVTTRSMNLFWSSPQLDPALSVCAAARPALQSQIAKQQLRFMEGALQTAAGLPEAGLRLLDNLPGAPPEDSPDIWLLAVTTKALGLALVGHVAQARALAEHGHSMHQTIGGGRLLPHPAIQLAPLALALSETGLISEAREACLSAFDTLQDSPSPLARQWLAYHIARAEWLAGHPSSARRWYAEAAAIARTHQHTRTTRLHVSGLIACAALTGDMDTAESLLPDLEQYAPSGFMAGEETLGTAWLHAARGKLSRARDLLHTAAADARRTGHTLSEVLLLTDIARLGDAPSVQHRLSELASHCDGALTHGRAHFAAALADNDPGRLMDCSHDFEQMGSPILAAEASAASAGAWTHRGDPRKATASTARATALAAQCEDARTPLLTTLGTPSSRLTKREQEIALMAAAGDSSKTISRHLTLSVRTVDNHLQRIYLKLGVRNRADLAKALEFPAARRPKTSGM
ncbi:LuxR C-terminal-related transcriptional regulator [Streptomyces avermitilis]|uniref:LuxR C-terminal-related transcriptional regulator n=1 Tax=Streptomyces avermitilis TaxID=33903 RepID=UPI0033B7D69A